VGVEEACLADDSFGHPRMAVADDGDVVVGVEQPIPVRVEEPDAFAADDVDRPAIAEVGECRAERLVAARGELAGRRRGSRAAERVGDLVGAGCVEQLEQLPRVVVPGLDVGRVLGVALDAPGADRDDRGQAGGDKVGEQFELERLERDARLVGVDRDPRGTEDVVRHGDARLASRSRLQLMLSSSNPSVASVPPFVSVPQFAGGGSFLITTSNPPAPTTVTISASGAGVTVTATLTVNPFASGPSPSALSLSPATVTGGASSTGTVTLTSAAPSGGAAVTLTSNNSAVATVPAGVTVPAGATSASFTVTSKPVTTQSSVTISASYGGATRTALLTVTAAASDTVSISLAQFDAAKGQLSVEATSTSDTATLQVYVSSSGALIGTLTNAGGGRYRGQFALASNPQTITVKSSLGGSATKAVTLK
jgi:hypothetical protein